MALPREAPHPSNINYLAKGLGDNSLTEAHSVSLGTPKPAALFPPLLSSKHLLSVVITAEVTTILGFGRSRAAVLFARATMIRGVHCAAAPNRVEPGSRTGSYRRGGRRRVSRGPAGSISGVRRALVRVEREGRGRTGFAA